MQNINNLRIKAFKDISSPAEVMEKVAITEKASSTVFKAREDIQGILAGKDDRQIVIVGPCSIHDYDLALEYAEKLNVLREKVEDKMVLIMRTYFEKPRTTVGWKGFIYDPYLDDSYSLGKGVEVAREMLVKINDMGLPTATEVLGPIVIQYYSDLICWSAIGARTTESQTHRELASGLSMPVGFKNGTEGNIDIAVNAILSANSKHHFLGMDDQGKVSVVETAGNEYGHIILRGGKNGPNYSAVDVVAVEEYCAEKEMEARMLIDCSHANSLKDHTKQGLVWKDVWGQIADGSKSICGLMIESNINPGKQSIGGGFGELQHGVSVTDACIGWEETEELIMEAYNGRAQL
jgi:3-deoxy-7-phosphoheptulonate synthase